MARKINTAGKDLIKWFESCRLEAYLDSVKVPTIGYGHTEGVKLGQKISQHQADVVFDFDLEIFEEGVEKLVRGITVSDNEFSALIAFAFNVGLAALTNSTLLKKLRKGDKAGAADEFPRWNKAGGVVLNGLVKRRAAERELFLAS